MVEQTGPLNVAILAVPEVTASALYGMFDLFSSPGRDFLFITQRSSGERSACGPMSSPGTTASFAPQTAIWVRPDHGLSDCPRPDIVCIPDFFVNPGESVAGQYDAEAKLAEARP